LEGDVAKRRPVIVLSPPDRLKTDSTILVVATSTSALESEKDRIQLRSLADQPQTKTGLPKPCWAVPRWYLLVERRRLSKPIGYVSGGLLRKIVPAVMRRMG
jgi:mRNA-degrading endonuclease toxin of MazEF toxin-antitoxin module